MKVLARRTTKMMSKVVGKCRTTKVMSRVVGVDMLLWMVDRF